MTDRRATGGKHEGSLFYKNKNQVRNDIRDSCLVKNDFAMMKALTKNLMKILRVFLFMIVKLNARKMNLLSNKRITSLSNHLKSYINYVKDNSFKK